jgi:type VI secretion system VasD/TssJ family lipoprotein
LKRSLFVPALLICIFIIAACASKPAPAPPAPIAPPEWRYEKDAVKFTFQADPQLNLYNKQSHTLQLCIYQLKEPNAFNQMGETVDGLYKLLECTLFDASVANCKRLTVRPGETLPVVTDRAEGARFIGISAGYANITKERITRLIEIPTAIVDEGARKVSKPQPVDRKMLLGPLQIEAGKGE